MANSRPSSLILPSRVFDETNTNNISTFPRPSSSSSTDSTSDKNINFNEKNSLPQNVITTTTTSSTTSDSDSDSDQDDNLQLQHQKNDFNTSEQLSRRVKHFRKLFQTEIPDDMPELIDSYVCAYQGDILLQGKMYITDRYLCFHSRIIKYVTKHVYRWEQIESVKKERVAFIFPTAICIQLKQTGKKIVYASFLQRDQAYEKIHSIWSRCTSEIHSFEDDDNDLPQDGTLKANNYYNKSKYSNRETYDNVDESGQDVLQMCLKPNPKRTSSNTKKIYDDKQSTKKLVDSYEKKISSKNSNQDQKSSINQTTRRSRYIKNEQKLNDTTKRNTSRKSHRSPSTSPQNGIHDQTDDILSHSNSSSTVIQNTDSSITNTDLNGIFLKFFNRILFFLSQIRRYISLLFPSYPIKTLIIVLLILTILFFHSFYLIKVAYRIENRLQSLYHQWPPSSSSMKNSFSSTIK